MTIEEEINRLGPLQKIAAVIIEYAKEGAKRSGSAFVMHGEEWTLEPDNWINLKFIYIRKFRIQVSLQIYPSTIGPVEGLDVKQGRFASWSKIAIENVLQLPAAFSCIDSTYYLASNSYRRRHGKPKPLTENLNL
jgi:hypothetical protein